MKVARIIVKTLFFVLLILDIVVFSLIGYMSLTLGNDYKINRGETLEIDAPLPVTVEYNGTSFASGYERSNVGKNFRVDLKMFGAIPFSTVNVEVVDEMYVAVLGMPFGMKLYTEGVLVIDLTDVDTASGNVNPSKQAGIKIGDYVCTANGMEITCNEDLSAIVAESMGKTIELEILRDKKRMNIYVEPVLSKETNTYRIGMWVRDSSAGIGTLTFYSPLSGVVCGLGHGICDEDTGSILSVNSGEMVSAKIVSVKKGNDGAPGELKGAFTNETIADIDLNTECGVYGDLKGKIAISALTEIALKQEIKNGNAQILCTVDGTTPKLYSCIVKKRNASYHSKTQNLVVTITDPELLSATGGIVQGMSGSPLIQNGKLIGAVTHVLVDDPTKGYAIFAENMLETAQLVSEQQLKEAS